MRKKTIKAWAVFLYDLPLFQNWDTDPPNLKQRARIYQTKEHAKQIYPDGTVVPCTITYFLPNRTKKGRSKNI